MTRLSNILVLLLILLLPNLVQAFNIKYHDTLASPKSFEICEASRPNGRGFPVRNNSLFNKAPLDPALKSGDCKELAGQTGRQKALKQRGIKVTRDKDDLVRRTVRAHGGDYFRNGDMVVLTLKGKTYRDFSLEIVEGKYLIIITPGDSFTLEVVDK